MKKISTQEASLRVDDLFEFLDIKGSRPLYNELIGLITEYSLDTVKAGWVDIMHECSPPNGQLSGQIPKLGRIRGIFDKKQTVINQVYDPVEPLPTNDRDQLSIFLKMCQDDIVAIKEKRLTKEKMLETHAEFLKSVGADYNLSRQAR
tara:strand:+ start:1137 stop:1580 length:444 start_codon:yes stop_codon:yes gene_type:complete